jgi:hypothetical protein
MKMEFRVAWHRPGACWLVRMDDEVCGYYRSRTEAVAAATGAARGAQEAGADAQVWDDIAGRVY